MKDYFYTDCAPFIKLNSYFENRRIKPLLARSIVSSKGTTYRTEREWEGNITFAENHCYVFVPIDGKLFHDSGKPIKPFAKKPSDVANLIEQGIITVDKLLNYK